MIFALDTEQTTFNNGDPFDPRNKLCNVGIFSLELGRKSWKIAYDNEPYGENIKQLSRTIREASLIIGHNIKRDLHWLRRYGIVLPRFIWDTQLVDYILSNQSHLFPALGTLAAESGFGAKTDLESFWERGINTDEIPYELVKERVESDAELTYRIYEQQRKEVERRNILPLITVHNMDLLVLAEMEWNGMRYDVEKSYVLAEKLAREIAELNLQLVAYAPPDLGCREYLNFGSGDHLSAILYGGPIHYRVREKYAVTLKSGHVKEREHWIDKKEITPGMIKPDKNMALKKEGFYETNIPTLRNLLRRADKKTAEFIRLLLKRSALEQLVSTYYRGIPKKFVEKGWENNLAHPTFHQCSTANARLSCSNPNFQNQSEESKKCFISRW